MLEQATMRVYSCSIAGAPRKDRTLTIVEVN